MSKIYRTFEQAISRPRLARYLSACGQNKSQALKLYRYNIKLSQELYGVLSILEILLRNAIDAHYRAQFSSTDWLVDQSHPTGFLSHPSLKNFRGRFESKELVQDAVRKLGSAYTHNKLIGELMFGFWRYLFAPKQFVAGGNTLMKLFINKPKGVNYKDIFNILTEINKLRNRIAHHEPLCFGIGATISTTFARQQYTAIIDMIDWLGYSPKGLLKGIDHVDSILNKIDKV